MIEFEATFDWWRALVAGDELPSLAERLNAKTYDVHSDVSYQVVDRTDAADSVLVPDGVAALAARIETDVIGADGSSGAGYRFALRREHHWPDVPPMRARPAASYSTSLKRRTARASPPVGRRRRRWSPSCTRAGGRSSGRSWRRKGSRRRSRRAPTRAPSRATAISKVVASPAVPTGLGAGTNEDRVIIFPGDTLALLTSPPTVSVTMQANATTMTANLVGHQYAALNVGRGIPSATVIISGTGLVTP